MTIEVLSLDERKKQLESFHKSRLRAKQTIIDTILFIIFIICKNHLSDNTLFTSSDAVLTFFFFCGGIIFGDLLKFNVHINVEEE